MAARQVRVRSEHFAGEVFAFTVGGLILSPLAAAANLFHSYTPFLLLRLWVLGFCWYGITLARRAGGHRRLFRFMYALVVLPFLFIWGLPIDTWALIDWGAALLIALSAPLLRTEPVDPAKLQQTHSRVSS